MHDFLNPESVAPPLGKYSHGAWVKAGADLLYIAGQVGVRPDGNLPATLAEQAEEAYANVARVLSAAQMTPANLVKLGIYAVYGQDLAVLRAARQKVLGEIRPASTLIFVPQLAEPRYLVEVEAVAAR